MSSCRATNANAGPPRPRLSAAGQVYVTLAAAREYARASQRTHEEPMREEEARRELTELLLDAVRVEDDTEDPERWRFRRRRDSIDISARVVRDGRLLVVVSVTARGYPSR